MRVWKVEILLALSVLAGCAGQEVKVAPKDGITERKGQVVWAEDASELAYAVITEEKQTTPEGEEKLNIRHQLFVQNPDGSQKREVSRARDHQSGALYYMKQAGYLVVESVLSTGARRFDRVLMNGNEILIIETSEKPHQACPNVSLPHTVIPSPDGRVLASIYSSDCGQISVEFMYANNLSMIDAQTLDITQGVIPVWHPEGYLILVTQDGSTAWKVVIKEAAKKITAPLCKSPATSSSHIAADGRMASFEEEILQIKEGSKQAAFGCPQ
ncbi:MAG: hypothetical protein RL368_1136 [Pseudomonadota bacterium]|jgi:Tol biopolymer transport system component